MKKLFLFGASLISGYASVAVAADTIATTTYSTPQVLTAAGCTITNVKSVVVDTTANTITTDGTVAGTCGSGGGGGTTPTASVSLSISSPTYTLGSATSAPVITWTNNTSGAPVSCSLSPTNGFSATPSSNTFILSTPTTAGTFSFQPTCTAAGYNVSVVPTAVSLTVSPAQQVQPGTCDPTQLSTSVGGKKLTRQCSGEVSFNSDYIGHTVYTANSFDLSTILNGGAFPNYISGYAPTFLYVASGSYIAFSFTPTAAGAMQWVANTSYGDGGIIALSTTPGALMSGDAGNVCSYTRQGANSMYVTTATPAACHVDVGTTYYLNFADVDLSGNALCFSSRANTCTTSQIAYTLYSSGSR